MYGTFKSGTCRKGVLFPPNTTTYQKNQNSQHTTRETRLTCAGCKKEFLVPTKTTAYRCYACQHISNPISGYEQSREDSVAKLSKQDNTNKKGCLQSMPFDSTNSSSSLPRRRFNKRAVLCGVTYGKRKFRLKGTINDVGNMKDLLVNHFKFPVECIRILTEEAHDPCLIPTKRNIMESLKWLVKDCHSGDSLVFYFSGHGLQQPESHKQDEIDGLDENLCPVDFITKGMITDNEINSTIVWPLVDGVTLHAIVDACHSGTTLDLMYVYKEQNEILNWEDNKPRSKEPLRKHTNGGLVICLSACRDSQMAADTTVFGGKGMNGLMTYLFTKIIRDHPQITYGGLLEKIHEEIGKINQSKYQNSLLKCIFHHKVVIEQDPLLSSSEKFDVSKKIFTL